MAPIQRKTLFGAPASILGRNPADPDAAPSQRPGVKEAASAAYRYTTGATGTSKVTVFKGKHDLDRGGMVLRFVVENVDASFLPHATITPHGVDLHIAGEAESEAMILALQTALTALNADRARRVGVHV
ncbi:MAG: hypothetical protein H6830_07630 [Planctomycetes bacterium]|nr:hypothetical protein [Planctomycetota bacterium]MCB9910269.1 hypothetical protein [Planctomycetota bacterium]HPF12904.1 hypothetical protein [Planctomycetota bacterium]HRV82213.1 hypothetical protein [Planctomycetota bacterium]